jgi:hypothetical protein
MFLQVQMSYDGKIKEWYLLVSGLEAFCKLQLVDATQETGVKLGTILCGQFCPFFLQHRE